jgi:hypothetical protein
VLKAKEPQLRLQRTEQQLRLFQEISRRMACEMSLQEVLQGIVNLVLMGDVVGEGRMFLMVLDEQKPQTVVCR